MNSTLSLFLNAMLTKFVLLAIVFVIDLLGGVLFSVKAGTFNLEKVPESLLKFGQFLWAWLVAEVLFFLPTFLQVEISGFAGYLQDYGPQAIYALIILKYVSSIAQKISQVKEITLLTSLGLGPKAEG